MSRNSSGTYTLPTGNPVVSGTVIEANWANNTLSDIATALTDSLSRSGQGGMTAPFRLVDGTVSAPAFAFANETGSGAYRSAAGDWYLTVLGANIMRLRSSGADVTGALGVSGDATVGGTLGVTGNTTLSGTLGVTGNATLSANLSLNGSGARVLADFSNATPESRTIFQTSTTNGTTILPVMPNGTDTTSIFRAYSSSSPNNSSYGEIRAGSTKIEVVANREGTGSFLPLTFSTANAERVEIDTTGNLKIKTVGAALYFPDGTNQTTAAKEFPSGTKMLFQQTTAPTGWTKDTTHNDKALRVVSGTASSGGTVAFTTAFDSKSVSGTVGGTTLSISQIPSHQHYLKNANGYSGSVSSKEVQSWDGTGAGSGALYYTNFQGGGGSHTHSFTGTAINIDVQYVDVIIATKG